MSIVKMIHPYLKGVMVLPFARLAIDDIEALIDRGPKAPRAVRK